MNILALDCAVTRISLAVKTDNKFISTTYDIGMRQSEILVPAIDEILKKEQDNPTIGLLLCKDKDRLTVDYSLKSINVPIGVSSFEIEKYIPKDILEKLPTEEDLNLHIDIDEAEE